MLYMKKLSKEKIAFALIIAGPVLTIIGWVIGAATMFHVYDVMDCTKNCTVPSTAGPRWSAALVWLGITTGTAGIIWMLCLAWQKDRARKKRS